MTTTVSEGNAMTVEVTVEPTRNQDSVVFKLNRILLGPGTGQTYPDAATAQSHPIAAALFKIRGVVSVWIIGSEVQVTKDERVSWSRISGKIVEALRQTLA